MESAQARVARQLEDAGFRVHYRSTAIMLLGHPDHPGVEARLGTVFLEVARDDRVLYRAPLRSADVVEALRRLGNEDTQ